MHFRDTDERVDDDDDAVSDVAGRGSRTVEIHAAGSDAAVEGSDMKAAGLAGG